MVQMSDYLIWSIIGEKEFCSYKYKTNLGFLCKNNLNLTNLCFKKACPISNTKYATIVEQDGIFFLFKKDKNNQRFPSKVWKKIPLSRNFLKAIQEINLNLAFWPKFFLHYTKKKLTKLTQFFIRNRLKEIKRKKNFHLTGNFNWKTRTQQSKIESKLKIEKIIEHELLHRLNLGIYGKLYPQNPIQLWKANNFHKISIFEEKNSDSNFIDIKTKEQVQ